MSCEHCVNRRQFLAQSALAAAGLVAAEACGDGQIGPTGTTLSNGGLTVSLDDFPALANVGTVVDVGRQRALVRTGEDSFMALSKICTHEGCVTDVRNNRFECPCHGSIFSADGSVIRGPSGRAVTIGPLQHLTATFDPATNTVTLT